MELYWDSIEDIAERLLERRGDQDPLKVRFTDLLTWVTETDDFRDNPKDSTEGKLEAIQMAWLELYREENE